MTDWGPWERPTPLDEVPVPVSPQTCVWMRPQLRRAGSGLWEARPAQYRDETTGWESSCRIAAWAKPIEPVKGEQWWVALTYLTTCYLQPAKGAQPRHTNPRWRTAWMLADKQRLRPAELPGRYPSDFWRDELSRALGEFAASIGVRG